MRSQRSNIWPVALYLLLAAGACPTVHALELTADDTDEVASTAGRFAIEGKVYSPELLNFNSNWQKDTAVSINDGEFVGFLKQDGSFVISNVPSGSYVVDIVNPEYWYESVSGHMGLRVQFLEVLSDMPSYVGLFLQVMNVPLTILPRQYRVEINPKGKFRARKLNFVQPSQVVQVPYPLKMKAMTRFKYFQTREQWKITDFLFSSMGLMMVLPLLLMLVLPKMMNDPETRKEMENMNLNKMAGDLPDVSEYISSYLYPPKPAASPAAVQARRDAGESSTSKSCKGPAKANKKRN